MKEGDNVQLNNLALYMPCSPFVPKTTSLRFMNKEKYRVKGKILKIENDVVTIKTTTNDIQDIYIEYLELV